MGTRIDFYKGLATLKSFKIQSLCIVAFKIQSSYSALFGLFSLQNFKRSFESKSFSNNHVATF
jgi:hypothetical protein